MHAPAIQGPTNGWHIRSNARETPLSLTSRSLLHEPGEAIGQPVQLPLACKFRRLTPRRDLGLQRRKRSGPVHGGDRTIKAKLIRLRLETAGREHILKRPILPEKTSGGSRSHPPGAGYLVRGIAAQRNEIRNLRRLHPIALAHLRRTDPRHLTRLDRLKNGGPCGGQLIGITVARCDNDRPPALLLGNRRRKKIIGFVAGSLGVSEPAGRDERRQDVELIDEFSVELSPALVLRQRPVPVRGLVQRVPSDQHRSRLLGLIETKKEVGKSDDRAPTLVAAPPDGLG